eukprot:s5096_g7.t1
MPKDAAGNLVVGEAEATATRAVIWLHGFGDSPEGWAMAWQPLQGLASWSWHHLSAPLLEQPCYGNKKLRGWGQFHTQEVIHVGSTDYIDEDKGGSYAASVAMVLAEIEKLEKKMPSEHVLIGGFSQGAAIALQCALQHPRPLAGCVAVSGWLTPTARKIVSDGWKGSTSFLLCHGTADDMVGFDCGEAAAQILSKAQASVEFKQFPGLKHESCPALMDAVASFMCKQLGHVLSESIDWEKGLDSESESEMMVYFPKGGVARLSEQLDQGATISQTEFQNLMNPDSLADGDLMVPAIISDLDALLSAAPEEAAKAVVAATKELASEDGPGEITAQEWRAMQEAPAGSEQAEEEDLSDDDDEEGGSPPDANQEGAEAAEPPAKRARGES